MCILIKVSRYKITLKYILYFFVSIEHDSYTLINRVEIIEDQTTLQKTLESVPQTKIIPRCWIISGVGSFQINFRCFIRLFFKNQLISLSCGWVFLNGFLVLNKPPLCSHLCSPLLFTIEFRSTPSPYQTPEINNFRTTWEEFFIFPMCCILK